MGAKDKKLENRYRFKTFAERIADISADVVHNVSLPRNETPEDADTFFFEELQKWADLNLTQHYSDFQVELGPDIQTFAQLLHRKDEVIALLQKHLAVEDSLALQPLLSLVSALARDLRADLGPAFPSLFSLLCQLLETRDPDRLQWLFSCLAHLYKLLWRHLTADMEATYQMYRQLLSGGRPPHVVRFAAESFAFVCRKVKDKTKFFTFVHRKLREDPSVEGVGRLIFETVRGIRGRLHADAGPVLRVQLELLAVPRLPSPLLQRALQAALLAAARHVTREHSAPIWDELWAAVERCAEERQDLLLRLLQLLLSLLQYRGGALLQDAGAAAAGCAALWRRNLQGSGVAAAAADLTAVLLTSPSAGLQPTDGVKLVNQALRSPQPAAAVLRLLGQLFQLQLFESHLLPELVAYIHRLPEEEAPEALALLARLVLQKRPPPASGDEWTDWSSYPLDFSFAMHKQSVRRSGRRAAAAASTEDPVVGLVTSLLLAPPPAGGSGPEEEQLWQGLLVAPHLRPLPQQELAAALWRRWQHLAQQIAAEVESEVEEDPPDPVSAVSVCAPSLPAPLRSQLTLLSQLTDTALRLSAAEGATCWPAALALTRSRRLASCPHLLRLLGLLLTAAEVPRSDQLLATLYRALGHNLASPHHKLRALTLYVLSLFTPALPEPPPPPTAAPPSLFVTCWAAEQCPAEVHSYQERLRHLRQLQAEYIQHALPTAVDCSLAPLLYLLGQLHVPFRLLWKPSQELLSGLCARLPAEMLAELWARLLEQTAAAVRAGQADAAAAEMEEVEQSSGTDGDEGTQRQLAAVQLSEAVDRLSALDDRVDAANFRLLLLNLTADLCSLLEESCGAQLIQQTFQFLEIEFFSSDMSFAKYQDLLDHKAPEMDIQKPVDRGEQAEDEEEDDDEEEEEKPVKKKRGEKKKGIVPALVAHLTMLSKMTSLRRSPHSTQLWDTFLHFLTHKRTDVQRAALECIYAYKGKGLNPYRETLFSLLEDINFKTRLTSLSIDTETGFLKAEHRPHVLPVLTRILYGRMRTSTGKGAACRDNSAARRRLVMGFLAGCAPSEIDAFLDLTLGALSQHVQEDSAAMVRALLSAADVRRAMPPRQLQSSLLLLSAVLLKLGRRLGESVPRLLRLLLCAGASAAGLLQHQHSLPLHHLRTLKKVRGSVLSVLGDLYERFDTRPWTAGETDAVFLACVWPSLPRLSQEATSGPTGLVKLFMVWAGKPRYFALLAKQCRPDECAEAAGQSPLSGLFSLLGRRALHASVTAVVVKVAELLLTSRPVQPQAEAEAEMEPLPPLAVSGAPNDGDVTGPGVVTAVVSPLLEFLRGRLEAGGAARLTPSELAVLSAVCRLESGAARQHAATLAGLLLPVLAAPRSPPEQRQRQLLTTLRHLLSAADRPQTFVRPLSALFSHLPGRDSHLAVCSCLRALADADATLAPLADTVEALNAMATLQVDEPDFERRLVVYGQINERLRQADKLEDDFLRLVVHNCLWFLEHEADLALRDSSSFCLQEVARTVGRLCATHRSAGTGFLSSCLLPALRLRLRSKGDELRHETVAVLQATVTACGQYLPRLQQLSQLSSSEPELNFFENVRHIQVHRRTRALKRVAEGLTDGTLDMRVDVVTNYILPLANVYLFNDKYNKYQGLNEIAVRLIGVVAGRMTWHQYQAFLRHFLSVLPTCARQRDAVRVLVAVLDAFHFDLSAVTPDVTMSIISAARSDASGWRTQGELGTKAELSGEATGEVGAAVSADAVKNKAGGGAEGDKQEESGTKETLAAVGTGPEEPDHTDGPTDDAAAVELAEEAESETSVAGDGSSVSGGSRQAEAICRTLIRSTLPSLHAGLVRRARGEDRYGGGSSASDAEEERAQRLPLALAMVKLLQKLPHGILDANVASVLVRLCELLRSRTPSVRESARETLGRCLRALGPQHVPLALRELRSSAGRGYQLHVMVYSTHALLRCMAEQLQPGDLDSCVTDIIEVCHMELFEQQAEEKEVDKITSKTAEAKGTKAYKMLHLLAQFISESSLFPLIRPLQQWALTSRTAKASGKVAECLRHACSGLVENAALTVPALLVLGHGLVAESLPPPPGAAGAAPQKKAAPLPAWLRRPDPLLVPQTPKRAGTPAKVTSSTNAHLLVDFGLQLLSSLLRKDRVLKEEHQHLAMLDPFLSLLVGCLEHPNVSLVTVCLRCWTHLLTFPLPSLPQHLPAVTTTLFTLLHKYAVPGLAPGDNFTMVAIAFKAVTVLVREVRTYTLTEEQLRVLLAYAEQDLLDAGRQGAAFQLLRAVLARRLHAPELASVMTRLRQLAVTAGGTQQRHQARAVLMQYLLDYPLGEAVNKHVSFFLQQLGYEEEAGRLAALEMCADICRQFPRGRLSGLAPLLLLYLSSRLVSDPAPACRRQVAATITGLLSRVTPEKRQELLDMSLTWLTEDAANPAKQMEQARMAAQLVGLFLQEGSGAVPDSHLDLVLPHLCRRLDPDLNDYFSSVPQLTAEPERHSDHLLYQLLLSLLKLLTRWPATMDAGHRHTALLTKTWGHVKQYLLHPHAWVRLAAGRLLGLLLSRVEPAAAAAALTSQEPEATPALPPYLAAVPARRLRGLALDLCVQLSSELLSDALADQCVKNLVWVAKVLICADAVDSPPAESEPAPPSPSKRVRRDSGPGSPRKRTDSEPSLKGRKQTDSEPSLKGRKRTDSGSSLKGRKRTDSESSLKGRKRTESESSRGGRERLDSESGSGRRRTESESSAPDSAEWGLSLRWLTRRLRREVNAEVVKTPKITMRRSCVFKWAAAVSLSLEKRLPVALPLLLPPLVREMTDAAAPLQLKTLATEVTDLMKRQVGVETFTVAYSRAQQVLSQRRAERRGRRAQELLTNPAKTARLKMQKHLKKGAAKKRKLLQDKQVGFKRRKTAA